MTADRTILAVLTIIVAMHAFVLMDLRRAVHELETNVDQMDHRLDGIEGAAPSVFENPLNDTLFTPLGAAVNVNATTATPREIIDAYNMR